MTPADRDCLARVVQTNCHIADARHAADLTLCTYLLLMREFFRWEQGLALGAALDRAQVGDWIAAREALWESLESRPFGPLPIDPGDPALDPFDVEAVNARLAPRGLLYGAGLLGAGRPVFFLADLARLEWREGLPVTTAGREWARGLLAPPAALSSEPRSIVLRRDALRRACWQRYEAYALHPRDGSAMHWLARHYGLDDDLEQGLSRWTDDLAEIALLHELGEARVGARLDPAWAAMRLALPDRRTTLGIQAVRDLLADLELTLPALLDRDAPALVHGWFAQFEGLRKEFSPALEGAYRLWRDGDRGQALRDAIGRGLDHFDTLAGRLLELHARHGAEAGTAIQRLLSTP